MRRREFIRVVGLSAISPLLAQAQEGARAARIGVLWHAGSAEEEKVYLDILTKAFSDLGYVEGKNIVFLHRFPAELLERFRGFARELVESKPDVIVAITPSGAAVLKQTTSTIPIVFSVVPDPVGAGLVASLAHPGGNLTGLSGMGTDLSGKRLSLLREAVPNLSRVALLIDRSLDPNTTKHIISAYSKAAEEIGIVLHQIEVATPEAIDGAFSAAVNDGCEGAIVVGSMLANEGPRVGVSALAHRVPALSISAEKVRFGLLMSYGQNLNRNSRQDGWLRR